MQEHGTGKPGPQPAGAGNDHSGRDGRYEPRPRWVLALVGRMGPPVRKLWLTVHVSVSVGWLGAVAAFLALAVAALRSGDPDLVRGAYLAMDVTGWWVLVPLSIACLLTGVVQSLGTHWGLLRHYWVLATLVINVAATAVLVMFMGALGQLADRLGAPGATDAAVLELRDPSPVLHAAGALLVLLLATGAVGQQAPRTDAIRAAPGPRR